MPCSMSGAVQKKGASDKHNDFLLKVLVFGTDGRAYSPWRSHVRNGRSYAYYVPQSKIAEGAAASDLPRCPAGELGGWRTSPNQSIRHRKTRPNPSKSHLKTIA